MKRILLSSVAAAILMSGQAMAADLSVRNRAPVMKAPPMMATAYNWSGCYIGAHVGGGWGTKDWSSNDTSGDDPGSQDIDGILGGGQIGCNLQSGQVVWGLEGDVSWTGIKGDFSPFGDSSLESKVDWLATVTGRVGYAVDQWLFYVKGGVAFAGDKFTESFADASFRESQTRVGWTVGAGVEFALTGNWTAKLEYNYMDFGSDSVDLTRFSYDVDQQIHAVKFGLNYRFGGGPIVARY